MKNPYMGPGSLARMPVRGKIDEDWEILSKAYAVGYDTLNGRMIGTRQSAKTAVRNHFSQLKRLSRKYCPQKLRTIEKLERLALANLEGRLNDRVFLYNMRMLAMSHGATTSHIMQAEARINAVERYGPSRFKPAIVPPNRMTNLFKKSDKKLRKAYTSPKSWTKTPPKPSKPNLPKLGRRLNTRPKDSRRMIKKMFGVR